MLYFLASVSKSGLRVDEYLDKSILDVSKLFNCLL